MELLGIRLVGINAESGKKFLLTLALLVAAWALTRGLRFLANRFSRQGANVRAYFWSSQTITIGIAILFVVVFVSIWFDQPQRLTTALGLVSAGLAFALQRVVTAVAGYFIILRGRLFTTGDRISMGGVRGDVIRLGITNTTVMEMGQPPAVQMANPAMWVEARQYTGRIVTITNDKVFDTPIYNYTRDFPFIWEEMQIVVPFKADYAAAESILLEAARRHTVALSEMSREALRILEQRFLVRPSDTFPRIYYRLTDNWLELSVRFIVREHDIREVKDAISREVLKNYGQAGIEIASNTIDVVGFPPLRIRDERG